MYDYCLISLTFFYLTGNKTIIIFLYNAFNSFSRSKMLFLFAPRILVSITEDVCKYIYASNPFGIWNCPNNLLSYNSVNVNGSNCAIYVKIVKVCFSSFAHRIVIEFFVFNLIYEKISQSIFLSPSL